MRILLSGGEKMKLEFMQLNLGTEINILISLFVALTVISCLGCQSPKKLDISHNEIQQKNISVNGMNISYLDEGAGETLVLVHGIPTSSFLWRYMIKELSDNFRMIALDLPGFGDSDPPLNNNYSISNYATMFKSFLDAMSIEGATLICHDFGGPVAMTCALRYPEKFNRFVILDTFLNKDIPPMSFSMKVVKVRPFGEFFMWLWGKSIVKMGLQEGLKNKSLVTDEIVSRYYFSKLNTDKISATVLGLLRTDYEKDLLFVENSLHKISKPTIIIWAEDDVYLPYSLGEHIYKNITGSEIVQITNCGHFLQEEKPKQAVNIITQFLKKT